MMITEKEFRTLMTMPDLESLVVHSVESYRAIELPHAMNLSHLELEYDHAKTDIISLCDAVRKMPKLKNLVLTNVCYTVNERTGSWYNNAEVWKVFIQVAFLISSQKKNLVLLQNSGFGRDSEQFKITRTNDKCSETEKETLNLAVSFGDEATFFEQVKVFVRENLENYSVIML